MDGRREKNGEDGEELEAAHINRTDGLNNIYKPSADFMSDLSPPSGKSAPRFVNPV